MISDLHRGDDRGNESDTGVSVVDKVDKVMVQPIPNGRLGPVSLGHAREAGLWQCWCKGPCRILLYGPPHWFVCYSIKPRVLGPTTPT